MLPSSRFAWVAVAVFWLLIPVRQVLASVIFAGSSPNHHRHALSAHNSPIHQLQSRGVAPLYHSATSADIAAARSLVRESIAKSSILNKQDLIGLLGTATTSRPAMAPVPWRLSGGQVIQTTGRLPSCGSRPKSQRLLPLSPRPMPWPTPRALRPLRAALGRAIGWRALPGRGPIHCYGEARATTR